MNDTARTRGLYPGRVHGNRVICKEHYLLQLHIEGGFPSTKPGQFIQIGCQSPMDHNANPAQAYTEYEWADSWPTLTNPEMCSALAILRRPFSLAGRRDDPEGTILDIIHREVGIGTSWMAAREPGDRVDLIGPLGNAFSAPKGKANAILVGGGVGLPPMLYLAEYLKQVGIKATAFIGATSKDLLAITLSNSVAPSVEAKPTESVEEFIRHGYPSVVTTDDGSCGFKGRTTDALKLFLKSDQFQEPSTTIMYTCGPEPMMRAAADLALQYNIQCQVCVEQAMACGMGTCQSCVVKIQDDVAPQDTTAQGRAWRYRLTCTDGPIFDSGDIVW